MKKLLFVFITLMMVLIFRSYNVSADDNAENLKKVIYTVESNNGVNISPLDTYDMVDISGEKRFFVVTFMCDGNNGFAILDKEEDEVAIYALNSSVEFVHEMPMMLVSLFDYVVIDEENDSAVSLVSGISYVFSDLSKELQERKDTDEQDNEEDNEFLIPDDYIEESSMEMNGTRSNIIVYGGNDTSLVYNAGSNSGSYSTDCGINASAMYLRHMNNYFYYSYVSSAHSTETLLKICLAEISYNLYSATSDLTMPKVAAITRDYAITGDNPNDLIDRKLYVEEFYILYNSKNYTNRGEKIACLDHDEVDGYGPETVTIFKYNNDKYLYYIYQYSEAGDLKSSGAVVRVYLYENGLQDQYYVFSVPQSGDGRYWGVFCYYPDGNKDGDKIVPLNSISYYEPLG